MNIHMPSYFFTLLHIIHIYFLKVTWRTCKTWNNIKFHCYISGLLYFQNICTSYTFTYYLVLLKGYALVFKLSRILTNNKIKFKYTSPLDYSGISIFIWHKSHWVDDASRMLMAEYRIIKKSHMSRHILYSQTDKGYSFLINSRFWRTAEENTENFLIIFGCPLFKISMDLSNWNYTLI